MAGEQKKRFFHRQTAEAGGNYERNHTDMPVRPAVGEEILPKKKKRRKSLKKREYEKARNGNFLNGCGCGESLLMAAYAMRKFGASGEHGV